MSEKQRFHEETGRWTPLRPAPRCVRKCASRAASQPQQSFILCGTGTSTTCSTKRSGLRFSGNQTIFCLLLAQWDQEIVDLLLTHLDPFEHPLSNPRSARWSSSADPSETDQNRGHATSESDDGHNILRATLCSCPSFLQSRMFSKLPRARITHFASSSFCKIGVVKFHSNIFGLHHASCDCRPEGFPFNVCEYIMTHQCAKKRRFPQFIRGHFFQNQTRQNYVVHIFVQIQEAETGGCFVLIHCTSCGLLCVQFPSKIPGTFHLLWMFRIQFIKF